MACCVYVWEKRNRGVGNQIKNVHFWLHLYVNAGQRPFHHQPCISSALGPLFGTALHQCSSRLMSMASTLEQIKQCNALGAEKGHATGIIRLSQLTMAADALLAMGKLNARMFCEKMRMQLISKVLAMWIQNLPPSQPHLLDNASLKLIQVLVPNHLCSRAGQLQCSCS